MIKLYAGHIIKVEKQRRKTGVTYINSISNHFEYSAYGLYLFGVFIGILKKDRSNNE